MEIGEEIENGKKHAYSKKKKRKKKKRPKDIRVLIDLKLCFYSS